ncbi:MAG: nitroreductase [Arenicellales bacterium WSBS_2016_MAG_OTU3]
MKISDALRARKSVRAFFAQDVPRTTIESILDAARWAPSGTNTQPWQVAVVSGAQKQKLQCLLGNAFRTGQKPKMEYRYYPQEWVEPFLGRRRACGYQLFAAVNITRADKDKRLEQWAANYRAFDAPVMLFFFMDERLDKGSYMDFGMFLQSVMLAAVEHGLATCPQAALGEFPGIVKTFLGYEKNLTLMCGMALGFENPDAPVNAYRTPRESVESFTRFYV